MVKKIKNHKLLKFKYIIVDVTDDWVKVAKIEDGKITVLHSDHDWEGAYKSILDDLGIKIGEVNTWAEFDETGEDPNITLDHFKRAE